MSRKRHLATLMATAALLLLATSVADAQGCKVCVYEGGWIYVNPPSTCMVMPPASMALGESRAMYRVVVNNS